MRNLLIHIILSIFIIFGCSSEKDAFINKSYHYTTARFNGYFHGTEAYKTSLKNIENNHNDDFDNILEIYKYGNKKLNKSEYSNLNRAINKAAKMIDRHSMKFKKKGEFIEKNKNYIEIIKIKYG